MKTKTRTLLATCVFGIIGLTNINAAIADNKKLVNPEVVGTEKKETLTADSWLNNDALLKSAEVITALDADWYIEQYATKQIRLNGNAVANADFLISAEQATAAGSDKEIKKYAEKQVSRLSAKTGK